MNALQMTAAFRRLDTTPDKVLFDTFDLLDKTRGLNAVISIFSDSARRLADASTRRYAQGAPLSDLDGVPFAVKDNLAVSGERMTCGSKALENYVSSYSATVVRLLEQAGAIPVCSANMDEFGMGASGENSAFGPTLNPLDGTRAPGGSSSGAAALVSASCVPFALGSDTGGSIRQPASHCGVLGLKPSYGALSRFGLTAYASSLDQVGVLARSAFDLEAVFSILSAARDENDSTSDGTLIFAPPVTPACCRIAPIQNLIEEADEEVAAVIQDYLKTLSARCAVLSPVRMPDTHLIAPAYYVIACAEVSSNLGRFDGMRYGVRAGAPRSLDEAYCLNRALLGPEARKRIQMGAYVLSQDRYAAYYLRARAFREKITARFNAAFQTADLLAFPAAPTVAPPLGKTNAAAQYAADRMTACVNLAGLPAVTLRAGVGTSGMPVGIQLAAAHGNERTLLAFAQAIEKGGQAHV